MQPPQSHVSGDGAKGWPARAKPVLMALPWPIWQRVVYPLWLRWYEWWMTSASWREGVYEPGASCRWRGVKLICCTSHYAGIAATHPWDPGWGWTRQDANALWEPARPFDRFLLRLVGDPRRAA